MRKSVVILPTYEEAANIGPLIDSILATDASIDILVVDDDSPDGTGQLADRAASNSPRVHVLHRPGRRGRGLAGIAGFQWAVEKGYEIVAEMDADFSHSPEFIPALIENIQNNDVVVGSRRVPDGRYAFRRGFMRKILSFTANEYIRCLLNLKIRDCTSGFRAFKSGVLESIELDKMFSTGPSIVEEVLFACVKKNYRIKEIPIVFFNRRADRSKLTLFTLVGTFLAVLKMRWCDRRE